VTPFTAYIKIDKLFSKIINISKKLRVYLNHKIVPE